MALDWLRSSKAPATPGRATGTAGARYKAGEKAADDLDGENIVKRRHIDWQEHSVRWRWLLDSYEGGQRYRNSVYGPDRRGLPARNLFRHRREYPDPQTFPGNQLGYPGYTAGSALAGAENALGGIEDAGMFGGAWPGSLAADPSATAQDDDYEYRRSRTPVPEFVAEAVEIHLAKVYDQEIHREGPADLTAWWEDVDGRGTPVDDWMRETVAPLLLVLGNIDVCLDHPKAPPGEKIATRADELRLGLDRCVASYILPENMVWWRLDAAGRYAECLVREYVDPSDRKDHDARGNVIDPDGDGTAAEKWRKDYVRWRLWRSDESIVFCFGGDEVIERTPHRFGMVPIVRLVDLPRHRSAHIGKSRYEAIAEYQREYYNRDSELILSDTLQAHPFLSGPEDFCKADNTLSVGPGYVLPMKRDTEHGGYQSWEFVSPPKDPAESLRKNKQDIVDMKDRRACLSKPAGAAGGSGAGSGSSTTSQSGISKQLDATGGHKLLTSICKTLAKAERLLAEHAAMVLRNGPPEKADRDAIKVTYPSKFELFAAAEMTDNLIKLQAAMTASGNAPETEGEILQTIVRQTLLGLTDEAYEALDAEIALLMQSKATLVEQYREVGPASIADASNVEGGGSAEQAAGSDPTGKSAMTAVTGGVTVGPR